MSEIQIKELAPELAGDYLGFFDRDAFTDNPHWASCYCFFYNFGGSDEAWGKRTRAQNRAAKKRLIEKGHAHGLLAYRDGRVVGWCHAAPRTTLDRVQLFDRRFPDEVRPDTNQGGSIVCFVVAPDQRRQGIARELLAGACDLLKRQGLPFVETLPLKEPPKDDEKLSAAAHSYHGTLSMYGEAGFQQIGEAGPFAVMRKRL